MSLRTSSSLSLFAIWIYGQVNNAERPELSGCGRRQLQNRTSIDGQIPKLGAVSGKGSYRTYKTRTMIRRPQAVSVNTSILNV